MSIYLFRSFTRSNSSLFLCSGNALQSEVLRLREEMLLVDAGPGTPIICMQDEPTGVPINRANRFENKVGLLDLVAESMIKERARNDNDFVGSTDVAGEPRPRRLRQPRAWMELKKIWRTNTKVKGFIIEKVKGGYSVAIAGFITFLPFFRPIIISQRRSSNDRFTIESTKRTNIVVF
uniref:Ribosomal protein S1 n=1 Tax=Epirixanthes elongata TaxID=1562316 RepID=A0A6B7FHP5_EPIEO|nr:ribosomal protein S1 [Epirixanthes elongata]QBB73156.1 ribosomal protein S1 [Epirixanthes elongata]